MRALFRATPHPFAAPAALVVTIGLFIILSLLVGCGDSDLRPLATGRDGEIVVVIDSSHWEGAVGEALRSTLGEYIGTLPRPQRLFDLRPVQVASEAAFERVKTRRNVVIVAPLSDSTNAARILRNALAPDAREAILSGDVPIAGVPREDLWRRGQQVYYLTAANEDLLVDAIQERNEDMRYLFNRSERQRLRADMFAKMRQHDLEEYLMEEHGFAVNVQHDYQIAIDTTNFVWLRRILPETWRDLFIYYVEDADPSVLTPEWIYETRNALTERYLRGNLGGYVAIDMRRELITENINFLGRYGFETRGLWLIIDGYTEDGRPIVSGGGGPFVNYTFYDEASGRIYMIDGQVFAPNYPIREFLRQMEVIAYTFRTREEVQEPTTVAAGTD